MYIVHITFMYMFPTCYLPLLTHTHNIQAIAPTHEPTTTSTISAPQIHQSSPLTYLTLYYRGIYIRIGVYTWVYGLYTHLHINHPIHSYHQLATSHPHADSLIKPHSPDTFHHTNYPAPQSLHPHTNPHSHLHPTHPNLTSTPHIHTYIHSHTSRTHPHQLHPTSTLPSTHHIHTFTRAPTPNPTHLDPLHPHPHQTPYISPYPLHTPLT